MSPKRALSPLTVWFVLLSSLVLSQFAFPQSSILQPQSKAGTSGKLPPGITANGAPLAPQQTVVIPPGARSLPNASQLFRPATIAKPGQPGMIHSHAPDPNNPIFFTAPVYPTAGHYSQVIASADLNGDGALDLIVADECQSNSNCSVGGVDVLLNNGDGTYKPAVNYSSGGINAWYVTAGDVNGDGIADVVVVNNCADSNCYNSNVSVLLSNGDGTLQPPVSYALGGVSEPTVALADLNGDGELDIVTSTECASNSNCSSSVVSVLLNNGNGTFQPAASYSSGGLYAFAVGVGNFNGLPDLMVVNECASSSDCTATVGILLNNGNGTFQSPTSISAGGADGMSGIVGDFNGDGKADIAVWDDCASSNNCSNAGISVLLGNGDGTFQTPVVTLIPFQDFSPSQQFAVGDFNGDGKLDMVVGGNPYNYYYYNQELQLLLGNGDGSFQVSPVVSGTNSIRGVIAGDFNGDGKADLAAVSTCFYQSNCATGSVSLIFGNGNGTFQVPPTYSAGSSPIAAVIADLNRDGKPDVVVSDEGGSSVSVLLGNGDGTLQTAVSYSVGVAPWGVTVRDVNGDSIPDLIIADECGSGGCPSGGVSVLIGNGDGTFKAASTYASGGAYSFSVTTGDFNGDGKIDIAVSSECASDTSNGCTGGAVVGILLGNGDGTFQPALTVAVTGLYGFGIAAGDFNGDGKLDLAVSTECSSSSCSNGQMSILLGNGDGTFQPSVGYTTAGMYSLSVVTGDFNGDGKLDVATGDECTPNSCLTSNVSVLLGNGGGTFQSAVGYPIAYGLFGFQSLTVSDFNGDGFQDLAASTYYGGASLLTGNGDGTFQPHTDYDLLSNGNYGIAAGDLNLDGKPDLVIANIGNGQPGFITVLLNLTTGYRYSTTTSLTSSLNPAPGGQTVTFTATVSSASSGSPTGTVTFYDGSTLIGTGALSGNMATFSTSSLSIGAHSITAAYGGDSNFLSSTSAVLTETITSSTTTTSLGSLPNPSTYGQSVTFTASVTSAGGTPTGTVTFTDGATTLGTSALSGGQAVLSTSALGAGAHSIIATYGGSSSFNGSSSSPLAQSVNQASTTLAVGSSVNPSIYSQSVTFTATVTPQYGGQATGNVTFKDGANVIGTAAVSGNSASLVTNSLSLGTHSITASYSGDSNFTASSSGAISQTVNQATTTTAVTSSLNPAYIKQQITFTATVTGQYGGLPTGSVRFQSGSVTLGTATLNTAGQAMLTTSFAKAGTYSVTAIYAGDVNYQGSTSPALNEVVNRFPTTTSLSSSQNPSLATQPVTFTVNVSSTYGSIPNGDKVTLKDGSTVLATLTLNAGSATYSTSSLSAGVHTIIATYGGDSAFAGSATSLKQTVNKNATSTAVTSNNNPSSYAQAVTFTATVTDTIGGTPTGTITFRDGSTTLGTASLSGGSASLTVSTLAAGSHSIKAVYGGDATYLGSTSSALTQVVHKATTATAVTSSPNPSISGQLVTITATVSSGAGTPSGTVTFKQGANVIGSGTLNSSGVATMTTSTLPVGSDSITATYGGSADFFASAASTTQVVNQ